MYRIWAVGIILGLGLCGCAALNPKNWHWPSFSRNTRNPPEQNTTLPPLAEPPPSAPLAPGRTMSQHGNGVLAGQVIDAYYQRRPYSLIQVSLADGGEPPQEVQTDAQGYFVVQGLKPGQRYKLRAKARLGERVLTGITYATPPNVVVNIIVREGIVQDDSQDRPPTNSVRRSEESTHPVANPQSWHIPASDGDKPWAPAGLRHTNTSNPGSPYPTQPPQSPLRCNQPSGIPSLVVPPPSLISQSAAPSALGSTQGRTGSLPVAQLANPVPWPGATHPRHQEVPPPAATIPSCRLSDNRLDDFALYDLTGQPFRFRESPARLTLLDFWGTWCRPCLHALPHLVDVQRRYGSQGLQVIGIAYEDGPLVEQQQRVNFVRQRLGLNYRILLGGGENCPLKNQLHVQSFPTVVLLDAQGNILWRSEGLDSQRLAQLEAEIRRRLY